MASGATILNAFATLIINCRTVTAQDQNCIKVVSGNVTVNPGCTLAKSGTSGTDPECIENIAGILTVNNCIMSSTINAVEVCSNVTPASSTYNLCRFVSTGTNGDGVSNLSGTMILKSCTIIATGSGESVVAASTVKVYGASEANLPVGAGVTMQVGFMTIDVNVI